MTGDAMTAHAEVECAYSLFQQPWWLDAVAAGAWREVTVRQDDRIVARLPYVRRRTRGMTVLGQPPLTQTLGPWLEPSRGKPANALGRELALMTELVERLPPADRFLQAFAPQVLNALPFHWAGGRLAVRYTHRLERLGAEDELWAGLDSSVRGKIRKAQRGVEVRTDLGMDAFYDVWAMTFARQGLPAPYPRALLQRIEAACVARGSREILFAVDAGGRVHAVSYVVFDRSTAYHILSGADPALRRSGAGALLLWEAIRRVAPRTEVFDFEGSMLQGVEGVNRRFGARQAPYLVVTRDGRRMRAATAVRELARAATGRPEA